MKSLEELKEIINSHKKELEDKYYVKSIAIFGSYTRNEQTSESDVDILVEFSKPVGLLFIHLADYLEEILGVKVDLMTPEAIKPNRRKYIMEELIYV
ncbi:MAG TPA: nucleotidyltransferase family protein [Dictyoglomaceae bacterium]|nr:nucleotidyltransferase family protein [Dictyoglomaceae bacterium]